MKHTRVYPLACWILLGTAFLYTVLRAWSLPITHDEALTYLSHARGSFFDIFFYTHRFKPNNHLLNTLLVKVSVNTFGLSELSIRLPALLGHALYLAGIYKLLDIFLKKHVLIAGLVILAFNPFFLELFATGRGYALALGLSVWGIYFLLRFMQHERGNAADIRWGFALLALAATGSFSFLHLFLAAFLWLLGLSFARKQSLLKHTLPGFGLVAATCVYPSITMLFLSNEYIDGTTQQGFWQGTVLSLVQDFLYAQPYAQGWAILLLQWAVAMTVIAAVLLTMKGRDRLLTAALSWLAGCCVLVLLEGVLTKAGFVAGRTALYFMLLFALVFVLAARPLLPAVAAVVFAHFLSCINFEDYHLQNYCKPVPKVLEYIVNDRRGQELGPRSVRIGAHRLYTPMLNFYILKDDVRWLAFLPYHPDLNEDYDYYLLSPESAEHNKQLQEDLQKVSKKNLKTVMAFPAPKSYLALPQ